MNHIVFITIDTLRADHLGCYGYVRETSPRLDELAADGVLFENCISQTGHTLPAFTTMMTGLYPFGHGIVSTLYAHPDQPDQVVSDKHLMLAQIIQEHRWTTAAFDNLGEFACGPKWLTRGYDWYVSCVNHPGRVLCNVLAEEINARLLPWLPDHLSESLFLFVHYWDAHQPYNQPEPFWSMHVDGPAPEPVMAPDECEFLPTWGWPGRLAPERREYLARYDGDISYVDHHVGKLLDLLKQGGAYDDSWIIVSADHGEDMEEHNAPFEHRETYDCNTRVPLIVKPPKGFAEAGKRVGGIVGQIDFLPTILDIAGLEPPEPVDGESLLPLLRGLVGEAHPHLFTHGGAVKQNGRWQSGEVAVRTPEWKYILRGYPVTEIGHGHPDVRVLSAPPWRGDSSRPPADWIHYFNRLQKQELYELRSDPCEIDEQFREQPEKASDLRALVVEYIRKRPDLFAGAPPEE